MLQMTKPLLAILLLLPVTALACGGVSDLEQGCGNTFWCTHGMLILLSPLFLLSFLGYLAAGYLCCPRKVHELTHEWPFLIQFLLCGLLGFPFYIFALTVGGCLMVLTAAVGKIEPKISNQVDLDE